MHANRNISSGRGLSVLELLIVMSISAVIAGIGIPGLQNIALNARRVSAVNQLVGAVRFARSTAQARGATIVLCRTGATLSCNSDGLRWIVTDPATARILRVVDAEFNGRVVSNRSTFEFRPFPFTSTNGTVSFCDTRGGNNERAIVISQSGRPRLVRPVSEQGLQTCSAA